MKKKIKAAKKIQHRSRSISKRSQGGKISKGVMAAIAAVVILAGGGLYFMNGGSMSSSPLSGIVKAPLNPNCELNDPDLCKFMNNWANVTDYAVTSVSKDKAGASMESLFEVSGKEKTHMLSKGDSEMTSYEMISIGKTTYTKDFTDNKWWKTTYDEEKAKDLTKDFTESSEFDVAEAVEDKTEYKAMGKEACGNLNCFKYQIVTPGQDSTELIWFDDKDYLLRKQSSTDAEGNSYESTYAYGNINISEPSPVKEGTAEDMYMQNMSAEEKAEFEKMKNDSKQMMQSMPQEDTSGYEYTEETYAPEEQ